MTPEPPTISGSVPDHLGEHLRAVRKMYGWSLAEAAEHTGIPAVVIGSWERGGRRPTIAGADRLLRGYGEKLAVVPVTAAPQDLLGVGVLMLPQLMRYGADLLDSRPARALLADALDGLDSTGDPDEVIRSAGGGSGGG